MTRKQLQSLISAGVFSAALLSGVAYADDTTPAAPAAATTTPADATSTTTMAKHHKHHKKVAMHACAAKNDCKGQGGCATDGSKQNKSVGANLPSHACKAQNACKGQGGCATNG